MVPSILYSAVWERIDQYWLSGCLKTIDLSRLYCDYISNFSHFVSSRHSIKQVLLVLQNQKETSNMKVEMWHMYNWPLTAATAIYLGIHIYSSACELSILLQNIDIVRDTWHEYTYRDPLLLTKERSTITAATKQGY